MIELWIGGINYLIGILAVFITVYFIVWLIALLFGGDS